VYQLDESGDLASVMLLLSRVLLGQVPVPRPAR